MVKLTEQLGALGYGAVASNPDSIVRYLVVEPGAHDLSEEAPVKRYDENVVLVSSSLPTKPNTGQAHIPTQSEAVRSFLDDERVAAGLEPLSERPRYMTHKEVIEKMIEACTIDQALDQASRLRPAA